MPQRMGLEAVLRHLLDTETGRKAIRHLHTASELHQRSEGARRRHEIRAAVRQARRALSEQQQR
jgi:hypothetical protein